MSFKGCVSISMSTMKEMARDYRIASAKLAMRIQEKKARGDDPQSIKVLEDMLRETRAKQRYLESYYDGIRDPDLSLNHIYAPKRKRESDY